MSTFDWIISYAILIGGLLYFGATLFDRLQSRRHRPGRAEKRCQRRLGKSPRQWLLDLVRDLQTVGFFQDALDLDDDALIEHLEKRRMKVHGLSKDERGTPSLPLDLDPTHRLSELWVAQLDTKRVWWEDLEADVCQDNDVYAKDLRKWAAISCGAFKPTRISETWESETGPITVEFTLNGERHTLHPEYQDDWEDVGILDSINHLIERTGCQFCMVKTPDTSALVLALTEEERHHLTEKRGWRFE